ncbi:MAG: phosphatidylserine decarboxylase [Bacillus sp. (in: Bacteria)]|nr:phosphatidylserine decarboxylase [Bacillus sp. (in: firmicutes)]
MKKWIYRSFIELTNQRFVSYGLYKFTRSRMSKGFIRSFARYYRINAVEMEKSMDEYKTLHQFFVRKLKKGTRPISSEPMSVVSPVDAVIVDVGKVTPTKEIFVKGKTYSINEMLGSEEIAERYRGGTYIIFYLSPGHYHRIHSPFTGDVMEQWSLGGLSYPVNKYGLKYGKSPLSKNYRRITELKHSQGSIAIVKVGAMFVNSIHISNPNKRWEKGEEIAYFSFGSTVILLFNEETFQLSSEINVPMDVKVGQKIGTIIS